MIIKNNVLSRYLLLILVFLVPITYSRSNDESMSFTVASCNVLKQDLYKRNFKPKTDNADDYKSLEDRQTIFEDSELFINPHHDLKPDIVGLQEYYDSDTPHVYLNNRKFFHIQEEMGLYLVTKKNTFDLVDSNYVSFKTPTATDNGFLYQILNPKKNPTETLGVINTLLKGGVGSGSGFSYHQFRQAQLDEIMDFIASKPNITQWIIMGDFNWRYEDGKIQQWITDNDLTIGSTATTNYDTSRRGSNKLVKLDYILSKNITRSDDTVYPEVTKQNQRLLTHSTEDQERDYFSDHAILFATFTMDIPATQLQEPEKLPQQQKLTQAEEKQVVELLPQPKQEQEVYQPEPEQSKQEPQQQEELAQPKQELAQLPQEQLPQQQEQLAQPEQKPAQLRQDPKLKPEPEQPKPEEQQQSYHPLPYQQPYRQQQTSAPQYQQQEPYQQQYLPGQQQQQYYPEYNQAQQQQLQSQYQQQQPYQQQYQPGQQQQYDQERYQSPQQQYQQQPSQQQYKPQQQSQQQQQTMPQSQVKKYGKGHDIWDEEQKKIYWLEIIEAINKGNLETIKTYIPEFIHPNEIRADASKPKDYANAFMGTPLEMAQAQYAKRQKSGNAANIRQYKAIIDYILIAAGQKPTPALTTSPTESSQQKPGGAKKDIPWYHKAAQAVFEAVKKEL